ncbi:Acg family FMN-binding oxidoreductase [Actinoplanes sp. CA-142083]|uniref:Acg family FMN-binding oxidoreductase n=1 Tax=Actinoplanes sp. CA-142083 TaxID=3239903 RepID=UPI003D8F9CB0
MDTVVPPSRRVLVDCVHSATAAPSLHNSQPWRFRIRSGRIDVYADPDRRLPVLDPQGRELMISVGAAVLNLRLALREAGYLNDLQLFPEPGVVARVTATHPEPVSDELAALAEAIPHRHTNRLPFAHLAVPEKVLDKLRDAAHAEGAVLAVATPEGRDAILRLAGTADRVLRARPGYTTELARWTGDPRHDGVPIWAAGPWDALEAVPIRDFAQLSGEPRKRERFEPYPTILVLATHGDDRLAWVRAGQALQRVLLTATWHGVASTPIGQPVEVPEIRRRLLDPASGLSVQMVLRIGYGRMAGRTPRRPVTDVLTRQ